MITLNMFKDEKSLNGYEAQELDGPKILKSLVTHNTYDIRRMVQVKSMAK